MRHKKIRLKIIFDGGGLFVEKVSKAHLMCPAFEQIMNSNRKLIITTLCLIFGKISYNLRVKLVKFNAGCIYHKKK
jgi:hypothetical protein